jgi:hypothetical protein
MKPYSLSPWSSVSLCRNPYRKQEKTARAHYDGSQRASCSHHDLHSRILPSVIGSPGGGLGLDAIFHFGKKSLAVRWECNLR